MRVYNVITNRIWGNAVEKTFSSKKKAVSYVMAKDVYAVVERDPFFPNTVRDKWTKKNEVSENQWYKVTNGGKQTYVTKSANYKIEAIEVE